ncbi:transketolase [candidate division KSB1 bacterium]
MKKNLIDLMRTCIDVRRDVLEMVKRSGSGHIGGSFSAVEALVALYFHEMNVDPKNPRWEDRDRFVLSKGHACPTLYSILARKGFFPSEELKSLRKLGGYLQGHPHVSIDGIEMSTGSLALGFSPAVGMALAAKLKQKSYRTYALLGDGELAEGQIWEALMFAGHYNLDNLVAIVDYNKLQTDDFNTLIMDLEPLLDKFKSFGWYAMEVNGHDIDGLIFALNNARKIKKRPAMIVAHTIKGCGISFMEDDPKWHGSRAPTDEEFKLAIEELEMEHDSLT